jgi:hypothetical protein
MGFKGSEVQILSPRPKKKSINPSLADPGQILEFLPASWLLV